MTFQCFGFASQSIVLSAAWLFSLIIIHIFQLPHSSSGYVHYSMMLCHHINGTFTFQICQTSNTWLFHFTLAMADSESSLHDTERSLTDSHDLTRTSLTVIMRLQISQTKWKTMIAEGYGRRIWVESLARVRWKKNSIFWSLNWIAKKERNKKKLKTEFGKKRVVRWFR